MLFLGSSQSMADHGGVERGKGVSKAWPLCLTWILPPSSFLGWLKLSQSCPFVETLPTRSCLLPPHAGKFGMSTWLAHGTQLCNQTPLQVLPCRDLVDVVNNLQGVDFK